MKPESKTSYVLPFISIFSNSEQVLKVGFHLLIYGEKKKIVYCPILSFLFYCSRNYSTFFRIPFSPGTVKSILTLFLGPMVSVLSSVHNQDRVIRDYWTLLFRVSRQTVQSNRSDTDKPFLLRNPQSNGYMQDGRTEEKLTLDGEQVHHPPSRSHIRDVDSSRLLGRRKFLRLEVKTRIL